MPTNEHNPADGGRPTAGGDAPETDELVRVRAAARTATAAAIVTGLIAYNIARDHGWITPGPARSLNQFETPER